MSDVAVRYAITEEMIDASRCIADVVDPASGGLAVFAGVVRDHADGHEVTGLRYEAHPTAIDVLGDVCRRAAALPDVRRLCAVHRLGPLAIGDLAVVVAVSAPHREEAFVACRWLIDTLKAEVPIWKQETYADGRSSWVACP